MKIHELVVFLKKRENKSNVNKDPPAVSSQDFFSAVFCKFKEAIRCKNLCVFYQITTKQQVSFTTI